MLWTQYLLAFSLLTAPPDAPGAVGTPEGEIAGLRPALLSLAIQWEILDPREARYVLTRPEEYHDNLNMLRSRYQELTDAPALRDCLRFPDRATVNDFLAFNRSYRQNIDVRQPLQPAHWWKYQAALQETDHLYQIWDTVRDARCEYYYVAFRRQALKKLRDMVGEEAYYSGRLPPHVPLWRFQGIDD